MATPLAGQTISVSAPAKINLMLRVVGKRSDGYHDLVTWMQKLSLYDHISLTLTSSPSISLDVQGANIPAGETNLAWKAAGKFLEKSRKLQNLGVSIKLNKVIPAAAGLGGGSSDGGAVLRGLNRLAGKEFSEKEMISMARCLGADVPFFAVDHPAVMATGIGDVMEPVAPVEDCTIILVNPNFELSTKWVFENFALTRENENFILPGFRESDSCALSSEHIYNDLESVSCKRFPEISQIKEQLLDAGARWAMMSGSGPTVFGIFPDDDKIDVDAVRDNLAADSEYKVFVVRACVGAWPSGEGTRF